MPHLSRARCVSLLASTRIKLVNTVAKATVLLDPLSHLTKQDAPFVPQGSTKINIANPVVKAIVLLDPTLRMIKQHVLFAQEDSIRIRTKCHTASVAMLDSTKIKINSPVAKVIAVLARS
jgi:hypothetical protein